MAWQVLIGRTMKSALIAGWMALAVAQAGCNSKTTMVAGAAGLVLGAVALSSTKDVPECRPPEFVCPGNVSDDSINLFVITAGAVVLAMSGAIFLGGAAGATYDVASKPSAVTPPAPVAAAAGPAATAMRGVPPSKTPPPSTSAPAAAQASPMVAPPLPENLSSTAPARAELALHIRLAARADRCPTARFLAEKLKAHDPDLVAALHEGDSYVARCLNATGPTTTTPAALLAPALP